MVLGRGCVFAFGGTPVRLRQKRRGRRSGYLVVIHLLESFSPCTVIKDREVSWHGGQLQYSGTFLTVAGRDDLIKEIGSLLIERQVKRWTASLIRGL
jgi:hypothetical protein